MTPSLSAAELEPIVADLCAANREFLARYPGESNRRQPVHVVYGGAHLFKADSTPKLGAVALRTLGASMRPTLRPLAGLLGAMWTPDFAATLYARIVEKLRREPGRISGSISRTVSATAWTARRTATPHQARSRSARGWRPERLPPFIGIRVKPFNEDLRARSMRTFDIFVSALIAKTGGKLPPNFVITIPKVQIAAHVTAAAKVCALLEKKLGLPERTLRLELMVETPQSIFGRDGRCPLLGFIEAADDRCASVHFGVYDYTASFGITAAYQAMGHPACDFARTAMVAALAGTGVHISDGATNILPVGPHRGENLTTEQVRENRDAVHGAWRRAFDDTLHSLRSGI